jgi:hypothetical protein
LHVVQLVLFALMGAAMWLLTDGLHGIATTVSRLGAAVFVVFYGAGDTLLGIATGMLARGAGDLPTEVREGRAEAIAMFFEDPIANVLYFVVDLQRTPLCTQFREQARARSPYTSVNSTWWSLWSAGRGS